MLYVYQCGQSVIFTDTNTHIYTDRHRHTQTHAHTHTPEREINTDKVREREIQLIKAQTYIYNETVIIYKH